jgi:hypothetical protein
VRDFVFAIRANFLAGHFRCRADLGITGAEHFRNDGYVVIRWEKKIAEICHHDLVLGLGSGFAKRNGATTEAGHNKMEEVDP